MKKFNLKTVGVAALAACVAITPACLTACGGDEGEDSGKYAGVTSTHIYVGNTAGTTGALAAIGAPFNYGIEAAFWEYNKAGGFSGTYAGSSVSGLKVALKHYDDGADATKTVTYTNRLIHEDEVFAIVGNFGSYGVAANLDTLKEERVPMVYAAAGNEEMANPAATGDDKYIFPVQPITSSEGRILIQRAFAPVDKGGLAATKVGVIGETTNDASNNIVKGIKAEAASLTDTQRANILYQEASDTTTNFGPEAAAIKAAGCDVIIVTTTASYKNVVTALMGAGYNATNCKILTTYNNAATTIFDNEGKFDSSFASIIAATYSQAWLNIMDLTNVYNEDTALVAAYKAMGEQYANGITGFNAEYWKTANVLYDFGAATAASVPSGYTPFTLSYDAYALAGYIAGNLFCTGLETLKSSGLELTRANYVSAMESAPIHLPMSGNISFENGRRLGIDAFALSQNYYIPKEDNPLASDFATLSTVVKDFATLDELRAANK